MIVPHRCVCVWNVFLFSQMSDIQRKLSLRISHVSVLMLALEGVWLQPLLYQVSLTSFPLVATSVSGGGGHEPPSSLDWFQGEFEQVMTA